MSYLRYLCLLAYTSSYINLLEKALEIRRIRTMALETYTIVNKLAPVCLHDLVNVDNYKYAFRYSNILDVPQVRTTRYGKKSFMFAAATLWNDLKLPNHFRTENSFNHFKSFIQSWSVILLLPLFSMALFCMQITYSAFCFISSAFSKF